MDEVDSIGSARTDNGGGGGDSEVQRTMLELLNQLDGFEATNKIKVCPAMTPVTLHGRQIAFLLNLWSLALERQFDLALLCRAALKVEAHCMLSSDSISGTSMASCRSLANWA